MFFVRNTEEVRLRFLFVSHQGGRWPLWTWSFITWLVFAGLFNKLVNGYLYSLTNEQWVFVSKRLRGLLRGRNYPVCLLIFVAALRVYPEVHSVMTINEGNRLSTRSQSRHWSACEADLGTTPSFFVLILFLPCPCLEAATPPGSV